MKAPLIHVASMVFNTPLAIIPEKLEAILRAIGPRLLMDVAELPEIEQALKAHPPVYQIGNLGVSRLDVGEFVVSPVSVGGTGVITVTPAAAEVLVLGDNGNGNGGGDKQKPYRLTPEGIAVVPIRGVLMKRYSWMSAASGCSSYAGLQDAATQALADPMVKALLFDVDSPGGTTHGCFELSEALFQMRGDKPIWAVANDLAASAAYALASAADRVFLTRTGAVGSIGVFAVHCDQSALDETMGNKYTFVYAGDKKTDGNPHQPLSKSARADIQAEVDREYEMFVNAVARNREKAGATPQKVRATEAGVYFGENASGLLADEVATFEEALGDLTRKVTGSKPAETKIGLQTPVASGNNGHQVGLVRGELTEEGAVMPAIAPHKTATSTKSWDGPAAKKNLRQGEDAAYYRSAYAFAKPGKDPKTKAGYSYIHHEVSSSGEVGAANVKACQTSIGVLNGGRGGTVLKGGDRKGVYNHVAKHLRDAGEEPAPLATYRDYIAAVLAYAQQKPEERQELYSTALVYLLAGEDAEEQEGETTMAKKDSEDMRRGKKSEAEDAEAVDAQQDGQDDDDEKKKPPADEEDAEGRRGKKGEAKKGEGKKQDDEDEDDQDGKSRRGSVSEMPLAANAPAKRIAELCQIAGAPELAADYIVRGYTVEKVIERLSARRAKSSAEGGVSSFVSGDAGAPGGGGRASVDSAIEQARIMAANSGGRLTQSQCMEKILRANPEIYDGYLEERGRVAAQVAFTGGGRALNDYVLNHQRRYMANLGLSTAIEEVPARRPM